MPKWQRLALAAAMSVGLPCVATAGPPAAEVAQTPVVLVMEGLDVELAIDVTRAIDTELNDLEVRVRGVRGPEDATLSGRLAAAAAAASTEEAAVGVFWVEPDDEGNLLLHLVDPSGERMLVRRVSATPGRPQTAIESLAVIARSITQALLEGRAIGMESVGGQTEDADPARDRDTTDGTEQTGSADGPRGIVGPGHDRGATEDPPRSRGPGRLRLDIAYAGTLWTRDDVTPWQSGVQLGLGWRWGVGVHAGASYLVFPVPTRVEDVAILEGIRADVTIRRHPIQGHVGYQHTFDIGKRGFGLAVHGDVALEVDITQRDEDVFFGLLDTDPQLEPDGGDRLQTLIGVPITGGASFFPLPQLSVYLAGGVQPMLLNAEYIVNVRDETGELAASEVATQIPRVLPIFSAGLRLYL